MDSERIVGGEGGDGGGGLRSERLGGVGGAGRGLSMYFFLSGVDGWATLLES